MCAIRRLLAVVVIIALTLAGGWWKSQHSSTPPPSLPRSTEQSQKKAQTPSSTNQISTSNIERLTTALNSDTVAERADAYAPGPVREAFTANASTGPSGGITLQPETFTLKEKDIAEMHADVPTFGTIILILTPAPADGEQQWYISSIRR